MVSSQSGQTSLGKMSERLRNQLMSDDLTVDELDGLMNQFIKQVGDGSWQQQGWPGNTYGVSKAGMTMLARVLARDVQTKGVSIHACCPGWIKTDMGGPSAPGLPDQGAVTPVHLALLSSSSSSADSSSDESDPSKQQQQQKKNGLFWVDSQVAPFYK